ncbi:hypothetical protein Gorai_005914, partial [Gossypium raimondii]|nr:hypothetical protein [Gossypium raimondii]
IVTCTIWFVWSARNKLVHKKNVILTHDIIYKVESYIREVDELQRKLPTRRVGNECWRPLEFPFHKLNFDAAFNRCGKRSCTGIVAVNLGRDPGFREVLIEGDTLSVITKMQACDIDDSLIKAYIHDAKHKPGGSNRCDFHHSQRRSGDTESRSDVPLRLP